MGMVHKFSLLDSIQVETTYVHEQLAVMRREVCRDSRPRCDAPEEESRTDGREDDRVMEKPTEENAEQQRAKQLEGVTNQATPCTRRRSTLFYCPTSHPSHDPAALPALKKVVAVGDLVTPESCL